MSQIMSLRVPEDVLLSLGKLAEATGRSKNYLAVQAVKDFLEREAWQIAETQEALRQADAGEMTSADEMAHLYRKWGCHAGD